MTADDFQKTYGVSPAQWIEQDAMITQISGCRMDPSTVLLRAEAKRLLGSQNPFVEASAPAPEMDNGPSALGPVDDNAAASIESLLSDEGDS